MRRLSLLIPLILFLLAFPSRGASAQARPMTLPPGVAQEALVQGLGAPTAFALSPDGRTYIALKAGRVKVLREGQLIGGAFYDFQDEVNHYADRGLMGVALHPNFPQTPYVYLAFTWQPPDAGDAAESGARTARVLRISADPKNLDVALPDSAVVILGSGGSVEVMGDLNRGDRAPFACDADPATTAYEPARDCLPVDGPSHTVDNLAFGPDGMLYVSVGDGTLQPELNVRAQDLDSLAGKVLRIDPISGKGLLDNPYYDGDPDSNRSKVFAYGVRNPYRFSFGSDGTLILGDVGGELWEEVNRVPAGANLGWPCFEGPARLNMTAPCPALASSGVTYGWYTYPHENEYSAAIGGVELRNSTLPSVYRDGYLFGDHNRAALLLLRGSGANASVETFASDAIAPVMMQVGGDGALYVLSFAQGTLWRLTGTRGANTPPAAGATHLVDDENAHIVDFDAAPSRDPDGGALSYRWEFGDGASSDEAAPSHDYAKGGAFRVRLTVTDDAGAQATTSFSVVTGTDAPQVRIFLPDVYELIPDARITLRAEATRADGAALPASSLRWRGVLHHNEHTHVDYFSATGATPTLVWDDHGENTWMELCVEATDGDAGADAGGESGKSGTACVELHPGEAASGAHGTPTENTEPDAQAAPVAQTEPDAQAVPRAQAEPVAANGGLTREIWYGIGGANLADLTGDARYPASPDKRDIVGVDLALQGKDYGERLRGWFIAPESGAYRFWIASDDQSELWLSRDASAENKRVIARVQGHTPRYGWETLNGQASVQISLEEGQRYYIEILHKQADIKDNLSVAWQPPGGERVVIPNSALIPME